MIIENIEFLFKVCYIKRDFEFFINNVSNGEIYDFSGIYHLVLEKTMIDSRKCFGVLYRAKKILLTCSTCR